MIPKDEQTTIQVPLLLRRHYNILFHIFIIVTVYAFWFVFSYDSIKDLHSFLQLFCYSGIFVAITYINMYCLFKPLFFRGMITTYLFTALLLFVLGGLTLQRVYAPSWSAYFRLLHTAGFYVETIILTILCTTFSGLGITYLLLRMWIKGERKISALAQANLKAELESLKKQISPHFLFNTLNNLYVLTQTKPAVAAETVLQLSDLIKYQLYECGYERVPLKREMEYIRSLLALEQLRKDKWAINIHFADNLPDTLHIEPLLFITLIENAIKHGSQQLQTGSIDIELQLEGNQLFFKISNTKPNNKMDKHVYPSIGLDNLKRRLELLYPQKHTLSLTNNADHYTAILTLTI